MKEISESMNHAGTILVNVDTSSVYGKMRTKTRVSDVSNVSNVSDISVSAIEDAFL